MERCHVDPRASADNRLARRGYKGRTALHWAARNGHVGVLRWLVTECLAPDDDSSSSGGAAVVDLGTADGTTAFCWAVWQGQLPAARYLCDEAGCDPHTLNSYGCTHQLIIGLTCVVMGVFN